MTFLINMLLSLALVTPPAPVSRLPQESETLTGVSDNAEIEEINPSKAAGDWIPVRSRWDLTLGVDLGECRFGRRAAVV